MPRPVPLLALACVTAMASALLPARAEDAREVGLVIQDHRFQPQELVVPAGVKLRLVIENKDPTPEEFESYPLNREKVVPGQGRVVVYLGPLEPGRYEFFGEFNMSSARGWLIVR